MCLLFRFDSPCFGMFEVNRQHVEGTPFQVIKPYLCCVDPTTNQVPGENNEERSKDSL
jgi:hypothetical protein